MTHQALSEFPRRLLAKPTDSPFLTPSTDPRRLWSVLIDNAPQAVVAAAHKSDAWRIADRFLACLGEKMFLTYIGRMNVGRGAVLPMERVA